MISLFLYPLIIFGCFAASTHAGAEQLSLNDISETEELAYEAAIANPADHGGNALLKDVPALASTLAALSSIYSLEVAHGFKEIAYSLQTSVTTHTEILTELLAQQGMTTTNQYQLCLLLTVARATLMEKQLGIKIPNFICNEAIERAIMLRDKKSSQRRWLKKRYLLLALLLLGLGITIAIGFKGFNAYKAKSRHAEAEAERVRVAEAERLRITEQVKNLIGEQEKLQQTTSQLADQNAALAGKLQQVTETAQRGQTQVLAAVEADKKTHEAAINALQEHTINICKRYEEELIAEHNRGLKLQDFVAKELVPQEDKKGFMHKFFIEDAKPGEWIKSSCEVIRELCRTAADGGKAFITAKRVMDELHGIGASGSWKSHKERANDDSEEGLTERIHALQEWAINNGAAKEKV